MQQCERCYGTVTFPRTEGTDFTATRCGYDEMGRTRRVKQALGTISRTEFDTLGRPIEQWMGTNDSGMPGGEPGTDNRTMLSATEYDNGSSSCSLPPCLGQPEWLLGRGALVGSARAPAGRRAPAPSRYPAGVERGCDGDGAGLGARGVIRLPRWGRGALGACFPGVQSHPWQHSRIPLGCGGGEVGRQGSQISDLRGQMGLGCEGGEAGSQI